MPAEAASPAQAVLPTMPVVRFNGHRRWHRPEQRRTSFDDSNNVTGAANVTLSGELDAATGDFSGIIDVAGAARSPALSAPQAARLAGAATVALGQRSQPLAWGNSTVR